jgi:hypothetical protein
MRAEYEEKTLGDSTKREFYGRIGACSTSDVCQRASIVGVRQIVWLRVTSTM